MKRMISISACVFLMVGSMLAQAAKGAADPKLESVLSDMDKAAAGFKSAQADFVWDQFSKVVNDHDYQKGVIYYRDAGKGVQMAADIREPAKKYVLFSDGKVDVYQPDIEQVTEYSAGKNKADFESFLVLGFGGRGHDLLKSFNVTYASDETVDVNASPQNVLNSPAASWVSGVAFHCYHGDPIKG